MAGCLKHCIQPLGTPPRLSTLPPPLHPSTHTQEVLDSARVELALLLSGQLVAFKRDADRMLAQHAIPRLRAAPIGS
jgi:hypothetical protein